jgi:hypothetical protein
MGNWRLLRIALLIWPLVIGVPAFVVAWVLTTVLVAAFPNQGPTLKGKR